MSPLEMESLIAATGVVNPDVKAGDIEKAATIVEKLTGRLRRWILSPKTVEFELPKQHDAEKLWDRLGSTTTQVPPLLDVHDATEYAAQVDAIRARLVKAYPVIVGHDKLDDAVLPPSEDEQQDWLASVAVIDVWDWLVFETETLEVMPEQVAMYRECFPALYAELAAAANGAISEVNAKGEELTDECESTLQILLETGQEPSAEQPEVEKQAPTSKKVDLKADAQKPPTQGGPE